jgi:hypothetical protein
MKIKTKIMISVIVAVLVILTGLLFAVKSISNNKSDCIAPAIMPPVPYRC